MITSGMQALVVKSDKFDEEVSVVDVKSSLMGELHSVGGSIRVPEELLVRASAANAAIEKSVRDMHENDCCVHRVGVQYYVWPW